MHLLLLTSLVWWVLPWLACTIWTPRRGWRVSACLAFWSWAPPLLQGSWSPRSWRPPAERPPLWSLSPPSAPTGTSMDTCAHLSTDLSYYSDLFEKKKNPHCSLRSTQKWLLIQAFGHTTFIRAFKLKAWMSNHFCMDLSVQRYFLNIRRVFLWHLSGKYYSDLSAYTRAINISYAVR